MCTPSTLPVSLLKRHLAIPVPSSSASALELALNEPDDLPSSKPSASALALACSSVRPTMAISGCVKHAAGLVEHLHLVVDLHEAAHGLDTGLVELEALRVGHAARAHEGGIDVEGRVRDLLLGLGVNKLDLDRLLAGLARHHLGGEDRGVAVNLARLDQHAVGHAPDVRVKGGHHR